LKAFSLKAFRHRTFDVVTVERYATRLPRFGKARNRAVGFLVRRIDDKMAISAKRIWFLKETV